MSNPFLTNIPIVYIVSAVRMEDGMEIENDLNECVRVWSRQDKTWKDQNETIHDNDLNVFPRAASDVDL